ncbi:MAG: dethiobiotin synthase [Muribaculaceae bacterium]|nr:dethiobiotin synthase [Muribaculaceae bacterium]
MKLPYTIFLTGIDTDAGKTYATAYLARYFMNRGLSVITQKFIQTGCVDQSEDIVAHRRLMNQPLQDVDLDGTTAPVIFTYPASAQLAAAIDGREIDLGLVDASRLKLASMYDVVIIEGAGGLMVPVTDDCFTIDYISRNHLPVALVTNGVLGSINHTVLSLEALRNRGIRLDYLIYNRHFDTDKIIAEDTFSFIKRYCHKWFPDAEVIDMPSFDSI